MSLGSSLWKAAKGVGNIYKEEMEKQYQKKVQYEEWLSSRSDELVMELYKKSRNDSSFDDMKRGCLRQEMIQRGLDLY